MVGEWAITNTLAGFGELIAHTGLPPPNLMQEESSIQ